ncbi:chromosome segregation protein SMC [Sphingomonas melonis TY]|uniref:Chromosome segregation protein SMC n=1 Tax=Sphingomonas melonis TY TaxID=621456 RepID=A0A175XZF3_9SPHN|nr:YhaN family protein [Sphingomonas melonis]KZB93605.1 chromosome segregation protein SMC [Sphingomonas melonis TY]
MRFASLMLERYGRFEGCELTFRAGAPDLHVIYGANEAGKSTSLAAVSDLLFGFPTRARYNFMFDNALLRVGAVLEEDGRSLACRRKRGNAATLIDAQERPIEEGELLAMLRGQTRETFALSFSLDQQRLRDGGRAMVEARDDVGRALFAAGSGLTGVSDELAALEAEADGIWGPRAAARRSFTQAQRELADSQRAERDQTLKPRAWLDARSAAAVAQTALEDVERRRDELLAETRRAGRLRRIAPAVRTRADLLSSLATLEVAPDIAPARAQAAETAMAEAEAATRDRNAAEQLVQETGARIAALPVDDAVIELGDEIDELVASAGAAEKGRRDLARLSGDLRAGEANLARLREDAGGVAAAPPARSVSGRLRELAAAHAQDLSALDQIAESETALAVRREALAGGSKEPAAIGRRALEAAIDAARALGDDADERTATASRRADEADAAAAAALARLAPWRGAAEALAILPSIPREEIASIRALLAEAAADAVRHRQDAARARGDAAAAALDEEQLAAEDAVSPEEIESVRANRDRSWSPLRESILSGAALASPEEAVEAFEVSVARADERSDRRFASADGSARLTMLARRRAASLLEARQAEARAAASDEGAAATRRAWSARLATTGHPDLDPDRLAGWLADREAALGVHAAAARAVEDAAVAKARRDDARAAVAAALGGEVPLPAGEALAPLLLHADRVRDELSEADERLRLNAAAAAQIERDAADLARRRAKLTGAAATRESEWRRHTEAASLSLVISGSMATLDALDDLRRAAASQEELQRRIAGIERDASEHERRVAALCDALAIPLGATGAERLAAARRRLAEARATRSARSSLQDTLDARTADVDAATARRNAALQAIEPLIAEIGATGLTGLQEAISRSREASAMREAIAAAEAAIVADGDGYSLEDLLAASERVDPDALAARSRALDAELEGLNAEVRAAADAQGDARRAFATLQEAGNPAAGAAFDAEAAKAELATLAEHYILKRAQAVTLRWAIERYREENQDPLLLRASALFASLTVGRYAALRVDADGPSPRLLGIRDDGRTVVEVGAMSEGTSDQLFLALRLAATEQSVAAGIRLPFLADDLFVNFDDERSEAGFRVLAELAASTQVLFFTHHPHLAALARSVVGADTHSGCSLA